MDRLRLLYSKTGKAKYIAHLDLLATMRRALLRAGVGLKYSEGFNPHPYMSVALPLQVGCESVCELMDISLIDGVQTDGIAERINASMPEGLSISETYTPVRKFNSIDWIGISGCLHYDRGAPADAGHPLAGKLFPQPGRAYDGRAAGRRNHGCGKPDRQHLQKEGRHPQDGRGQQGVRALSLVE